MTNQATCLAGAKINLALHVTGQRADGFHLLDSLVCFADIGDVLSVSLAPCSGLEVSGPMAASVPSGKDNLVLRAAGLMAPDRAVQIRLEKHLPVAAGIGGGSADAAACLLALRDICKLPLPGMAALMRLGADVPVCLRGKTTRMRGTGEKLDAVAHMPRFDAVLVNPGIAVSTPAVFAALGQAKTAAMDSFPAGSRHDDWMDFLTRQRNDLAGPAQSLAPVIGDVLAALGSSKGCEMARMSGSGATCFGLFRGEEMAVNAARSLAGANPRWWVRKVSLG